MTSPLRRLGLVADKSMSVLAWLHDSIMLFLCLFWLLPLIALVVISASICDLRPILRDRIQEVFLYSLVGLPLWFGVCLYAEFGATSAPAASRIGWGACLPTSAMCSWAWVAYFGCSALYETDLQ